ncbi:MAG: hypothetical protein HYY04_14605 [Chloroflexi bacterium]|nr:hypothetical protein [Chloroflexota bacterium]
MIDRAPATPSDRAAGDDWGDGLQVGTGRPPAWMRWFSYGIWVIAVVYLLLNLTPEHALPLITAVLMSGWIVYTYLARKPLEP